MAVDFTNTLIVAISATALFDLSESENHLVALLQQQPHEAIKEFRDYMAERETIRSASVLAIRLSKRC